ncbi:hypothetical protein COCOBI_02-6630 [Coccomyxa sp. Obi]|nr:hypothetical protein COCOBI_02-6630 [Coccomyxa sp. Obi]
MLIYPMPATAYKLLSQLSTALACTYLWDSSQRGKEVGLLELQDLTLPGGRSAVSLLQSGQLPQELIIEPLGTKTIKGRGKVAIPLQLAAPAAAQHCFIHRLSQFLRLCTTTGHPVTQYIFRPQSKGGGSFQEAPSSASCIYQRIVKALTEHGLYNGQSVHSYRRGNMQERHHKQGESKAVVAARALIKTDSIVNTYLDQSRHLPRKRRQQLLREESTQKHARL